MSDYQDTVFVDAAHAATDVGIEQIERDFRRHAWATAALYGVLAVAVTATLVLAA